MAARIAVIPQAVVQPQAALCDYCHQKPSHSTHKYCSKTCAAQAATLCGQCHKKPKYQNYEYCGKSCAAAANPAKAPAPAPAARNATTTRANTIPQGQKAANQGNPQFDPLQIAQLIVQQIPQLQSMMPQTQPNGQAQAQGQPQLHPIITSIAGIAGQVLAGQQKSQGAQAPAPPAKNNPFLNGIATAARVLSSSNNANVAAPILEDCHIPGCREPVHVDSFGQKTSNYCSMRHREEAVAGGLISPCIFCLSLPQSETDYFCGKECRHEAMTGKVVADE